MPNSHHQHTSTPENETPSFNRLTSNPPQHHTHVQQVAWGLLVNRSRGAAC
jgi:hypothetical protein